MPDSRFLSQLAQARARLDEWRALPTLDPQADPDNVVSIAQQRQKIAADLGQLYQNMAKDPQAKAADLAAIMRAVAVMRETTLIDLHLIHARANFTRAVLDAMGDSVVNAPRVSAPRATA